MSPAGMLRRLRNLPLDDGGQVLPIVCVFMTVMLGFSAFAIDLGRAMYTSRELQATTDATALAAARAMPTAASAAAITGSGGVVQQYSAATGGLNVRATLPGVTATSTLECLNTLKTQGMPCTGNVPYNAIQVQQSMTLTTFFGGLIGVRTLAMRGVATASIHGGAPRPANVAVVLDTTLSMNIYDSDCGMTALQCELNGFQVLLQNLDPCGLYQTTCASGTTYPNPFDSVALFTFPNVTVGTANIDTSCTYGYNASTASNYNWVNDAPYGWATFINTGNNDPPYPGMPTALPYSFPTPGKPYLGLKDVSGNPTYQITSFLTDYRTSDKATTLNQSSLLVKAAGAVSGCGSMTPPNFEADYETYYAGAIYAAQSAVAAQTAATPGSESVIIILSDGDSNALQYGGEVSGQNGFPINMAAPAPSGNYMTATASGTYPSWVGECGQAVDAASAATAAGTIVYSVGYGSEPSGCGTDSGAGSHPNITPCQTMASMASAPQYFYSDYNQNGVTTSCVSGQPATSLSGIFAAIAADLTEARLIPNNTT